MSVQRNEVIEALRDYLSDKILGRGVDFTDDTPFADLGVDSVTVIELSMEIEQKFGIEIPANDLLHENLRSVASLADCVVRHS